MWSPYCLQGLDAPQKVDVNISMACFCVETLNERVPPDIYIYSMALSHGTHSYWPVHGPFLNDLPQIPIPSLAGYNNDTFT